MVAGGRIHTDTVPDGRYDVFVTTGNDWDAAGEAFSRDCTFERFAETAAFTTTATSSAVYQIGLEVPEGNMTPVPVEPDAFPR